MLSLLTRCHRLVVIGQLVLSVATGSAATGPRERSIRVGAADLELLDFGGSGPPMVWLAGLGNTAHVFTSFAPRFVDRFRVVAVTRRGFGKSGMPDQRMDTDALVDDLAAILDSLQFDRVILVGHSVAGDELTRFAVRYPRRVAAVVYLDAAYDRSGAIGRLALWAAARQLPPPRPAPTGADRADRAAYQAYLESVNGVRWPMAEVLATQRFGPTGRWEGSATGATNNLALVRGELPLQYRSIEAPVLAVYANPRSIDREYPWIRGLVVGRGAAMNQARRAIQAQRAWEGGQRRRLRRELPSARVVEIREASHFLFLSDPDSVAAAIDGFLAEALP